MMQFAMTGRPAAPMPQEISPWDIYDVFTVSQGEQIFWPWWGTRSGRCFAMPLATPTGLQIRAYTLFALANLVIAKKSLLGSMDKSVCMAR